MSAYDNDQRVERVNDYFLMVTAADDQYQVAADTPTEWFTNPTPGGTSYRAANLSTRDDAETWAVRTTRGPFRCADEAIRELIGDPR